MLMGSHLVTAGSLIWVILVVILVTLILDGTKLDALEGPNTDSAAPFTNNEASKTGVFAVGLNAHGLGGNHLDNGAVTHLDRIR